MNEKSKNDFIFFQNEILGDVKKIEMKLIEKLTHTTSFIENQTERYDSKIKDLTNKINQLSLAVEKKDNVERLEKSMYQSQKKMEELLTKLEIKFNILDKDFHNACFKYDKIVSNNLIVPGLIGVSCPYESLKPFIEFINLKVGELLKAKDKQTLDTKKYKEKLELIISQSKTQFEIAQNKITDYCSDGLNRCDLICKDRMELLEKRIETLRLENGKHAYELKQKTEEVKIDWEKLNKIDNTLSRKYREEWNKFSDIVEKLSNKFEKNKEEFYLIKNRFSELSEFIKDIRFKKNIDDMNMGEVNINIDRKQLKELSNRINRSQYKELSNKIDFNKRRRTKRIQNYEMQKEFHEKGILATYDIYNDNHYSPEKNYSKAIENNSVNKVHDNNTNYNNNFDKKVNKIEESKKYNTIENNKNNDEMEPKNKNQKNDNTFSQDNNLNVLVENKDKINYNEIKKNNNREIMNANHNFMSNNNFSINKIDKMPDIKFINLKNKINHIDKDNSSTINQINYSNDNSTYNIINYNNHFNSNNPNINESSINNKLGQKNFEKNSVVENKERDNKFLGETAKINDLILGADFSENNLCKMNGPTYNLSQAYIILKRRNEEIQKMKKNHEEKSEKKYIQMSPSSVMNHSNNLNKTMNVFSKNDIKRVNKGDYYFNKNKINNLLNCNLNLTNQEFLNEKNDFPKILKNVVKNTNNKDSNINDSNIINENSFENNSKQQKRNKKKLLYSSSDSNIFEKIMPITPNFREWAFIDIDKNNVDLKYTIDRIDRKAKETLNHIKPYLIKKFQDQI